MSTEIARRTLADLRAEIEEVDAALVAIVAQRLTLAREAGVLKHAAGKPITDPAREAAVLVRASRLAREAGVPDDEIRTLFWHLLAMSRRVQIDACGGHVTVDALVKPLDGPTDLSTNAEHLRGYGR